MPSPRKRAARNHWRRVTTTTSSLAHHSGQIWFIEAATFKSGRLLRRRADDRARGACVSYRRFRDWRPLTGGFDEAHWLEQKQVRQPPRSGAGVRACSRTTEVRDGSRDRQYAARRTAPQGGNASPTRQVSSRRRAGPDVSKTSRTPPAGRKTAVSSSCLGLLRARSAA